jgi:hypothetical protein
VLQSNPIPIQWLELEPDQALDEVLEEGGVGPSGVVDALEDPCKKRAEFLP